MDAMTERAHEVLQDTEHDSTKKAERDKEWKTRTKMVDELKQNRQFLLEVVLTRHVENYLNYLSELLSEIFQQRPETLRSSDKVEMAEVLRHDTLESFVRAAAERKVESLSYASFESLNEFFEDRLGLMLFPAAVVPDVVEATETRNISVHNRCRINDRFCKRTGTDRSLMGQKKDLYITYLDSFVPLVFASVKTLDGKARKKLKLKGSRFSISDG